jgi:mannose-6-phosphate isomerase-like protein (cupin superfamily)
MVISTVEKEIKAKGFKVVASDKRRPWGGFFVLDETQVQLFADEYFEGLDVSSFEFNEKLSPKILVVQPAKRLSWQYHNRRAEIWRIIHGKVGVITSDTDEEGALRVLDIGDTIILEKGERHRLIGLQEIAVIAEIWQHTDKSNPSDEEDIIRVQDDFGR